MTRTYRWLSLFAISCLLGCYLQQAMWKHVRLVAPRSGETVTHSDVSFQWNPVSGVGVSYRLQIAAQLPDFSKPILDEKGIQGTQIVFNHLAPNKEYYWRVCANHRDRVYAWSRVKKFKTDLYMPSH